MWRIVFAVIVIIIIIRRVGVAATRTLENLSLIKPFRVITLPRWTKSRAGTNRIVFRTGRPVNRCTKRDKYFFVELAAKPCLILRGPLIASHQGFVIKYNT